MAGYDKKGCPEAISSYTPAKEMSQDDKPINTEGDIDEYFGSSREERMKPNVAGDIGEYGEEAKEEAKEKEED